MNSLADDGADVCLLAESEVEALAAAAPPRKMLPAHERARVRRLPTPGARRRRLGARLLARLLLARHAGVEPARLCFATGRYGRPELSPNPWRLRFNLSHTEGWIACVVTRSVPCGVDVQRPIDEVARRYLLAALSERERVRLAALDPRHRAAALVDTWAVKEAYTKALGVGLRYGFARLTVEGVPGGPVTLLPLASGRSWRFHLERLPTGHSLAVAVRRPEPCPIVIRHLMEGSVP